MEDQSHASEAGLKEKTALFTGHLEDLIHSYYKLGVLHVTDKATGIASFTITVLSVTFLALFALLFLGFGLGWWLSEQFNSMLAGYATVAAVFVLFIAIIIIFRKQVLFPAIRNLIIRRIYE